MIGKPDVRGVIRQKRGFQLVRDVEGYGYSYTTTVKLVSSKVGNDVVHYFMTNVFSVRKINKQFF